MNYQGKLLNETPINIEIENGYIESIKPIKSQQINSLPYIAPGMVDIQVNGFAGVDYNTLPLSMDDTMESMNALFKEGVTTFLPTIITNQADVISEILRNFEKIRDDNSIFGDAVPGYHIEGPFISNEDGPRGAHNKDFVGPPSTDFVDKWREASGNKIRIITFSPEWEGSTSFIEHCASIGIHVAIGHTAASTSQINSAAAAGSDLSTHLGNGCHLEMDRHDNYIWEQLSEDKLWASIIADGFHLPKAVLKVFLRVKSDKIILISDSTSFGGLAPGKYKTHIGGEVVLTEDGKLYLADNKKILAGSACSVLYGVNHLIGTGLLPAYEAWNTASLNPSRYLSLTKRGRLSAGNRADFVLLEKIDNKLVPFTTILNGRCVFNKSGNQEH